MCKCEQKKLTRILVAGDDLVAAIEHASWGAINHPTMHMTDAVAVWKEATCKLKPKFTE